MFWMLKVPSCLQDMIFPSLYRIINRAFYPLFVCVSVLPAHGDNSAAIVGILWNCD